MTKEVGDGEAGDPDPSTPEIVPPELLVELGEVGIASLRIDGDEMDWVGRHSLWGVPMVLRDGEVAQLIQSDRSGSPGGAVTATMSSETFRDDKGGLTVLVERRLVDGRSLEERFTCSIDDGASWNPEHRLGIRVPLPDDVEGGADVALEQRSASHLWTEGSSAWWCSLRLSGTPPHLGMILVEGALRGYSVIERPVTAETLLGAKLSNDRGCLTVHPELGALAPERPVTFGWRILAHQGWDEFWKLAAQLNPAFVRLSSDHLVVPVDGEVTVSAVGSPSREPTGRWMIEGADVVDEEPASVRLRATDPGPIEVRYERDSGAVERAVLHVVSAPNELIADRVAYLLDAKQVRQPGDPLDGAFTVIDTETDERIVNEGWPDHNAARERIGSGVLLGLALAEGYVPAEREAAARSGFDAFYEFYRREIESPDGVVHDTVGYGGQLRLFNAGWGMQAHLVAHLLRGDIEPLRQLANTVAAFYDNGGADTYPIGLPISWSIGAYAAAGLDAERDAVEAAFRSHADQIERVGRSFPTSEVAYEQSIVGPAVQILAETHLLAPDEGYLDAALNLIPLLDAFNGRQPHHRLNDIAVRHWDGFWFGKLQLLGDTMPHYWSTVTAVAHHLLAESTKNADAERFRGRADRALWANLVDVRADGSASCAYIYPETVEATKAAIADPYDNDQDWALVHWIQLRHDLIGTQALSTTTTDGP